jgi:hypothetical protein
MITPEELLNLGFDEFAWNGGIIMEYWLSLFPGTEKEWDYRLGIRFNEFRDKPFIVWLFTGSAMTQLRHIDTIEKASQLYELMTGVRCVLCDGCPMNRAYGKMVSRSKRNNRGRP